MINWFAITIISFWLFGSISAKFSNDSSGLFFALIATMLSAIVYLLIHI